MAIPPQFLKNVKSKKELEGKAEPGDSPKEDAAEGDTKGSKKSVSKHKKKLDPKQAKRAAMLAMIKKG